MRRAALVALILVGCVGCDHAAKQLAEQALLDAGRVSFLLDALQFELAYNTGGFLSVGAGLRSGARSVLFLGLVPLIVALLVGMALRGGDSSTAGLLGLGLIAGGGTSNWLDRVLNSGAVTDFVRIDIGVARTGIFNLADVFIMMGAALFLLAHSGMRAKRSPDHDG